MHAFLVRAVRFALAVALFLAVAAFPAAAQSQSTLRGKITDPVGQAVPDAKIFVLDDEQQVAHSSSDAGGLFDVAVPAGAQYDVRVEAQGFAPATVSSITAAAGKTTEIPTITLAI